jgi:putative transposase
MSEQTVRKTYQDTLRSTPHQEQELARVLGRVLGLCRSLSNTALEQRISAYQQRHVSLSRYQQEAELKGLRAAFPGYAAIHSQVLQEALAWLDKTSQAFFRRLQAGEMAGKRAGEKAGSPRFQGRNRSHAFTDKEDGNGATLDNDFLVLSTIGRIAVRWSRPIEGTAQNGHALHRSGGLVWLLLLR